jgi:translation initiation factor eIF-2B subunit delta
VADSHPLLEGRATLRKLREAGIECAYVLLPSISYVMPDVTKVLLGASALMSDGSVLGRSGTASVALAAHARRIPVLVCAETYKISNRVQLESLTVNELGISRSSSNYNNNKENNAAAGSGGGGEIRDDSSGGKDVLKRLHLLYDLTPAQFVSGIVTEFGIVPPTSVAVLLREMNPHDVTRK